MSRFGFFPVLILHELTKHSEICMISQSNIISFDSLYYNVIFVWFILWRKNTLSLLEMAVRLMSNPVVLYFIVRYQSSSFSPIVVLGRYFTFFCCLCHIDKVLIRSMTCYSAGVGRTGTYVAVDRLLQHIQDHDDIDIYNLVLEMRNYRCRMVQTEVGLRD